MLLVAEIFSAMFFVVVLFFTIRFYLLIDLEDHLIDKIDPIYFILHPKSWKAWTKQQIYKHFFE